LRQHVREIPAGVTIVDPADLFCDATVCYAGQHSISYYFDDDHMSLAGAGVVADAILSRLKIQEPSRVGSDPRHGDAMALAHSGRPGLEAVAGGPGHR
jgi:hypothetical protein